jgi:hypothetical protein
MFKTNKQLILAALALLTGSQALAGELASSASVTSNYIWRGISLSDDGPSAGLSAEYAFDNGFSLSGVVNTVDFDSFAKAHYELLLTGSFTTNLAGADVALAATAYNYPGDGTPDEWNEFTVGFDLPVSAASVGMELKYSTDALGYGDTYTTFAHFAMPFTKSAVAATIYYVDSEAAATLVGSKDHYSGVELSYAYDWTPSLSSKFSYSYADLSIASDSGDLFGKLTYKIC